MKEKNSFSRLYKQGKQPFGEEPPEYFQEALTYIQKGSLLDLGGGYGRFSIHFARQGLEVTNVDISTDAINNFFSKIQELQLKATGIVKDINEFDFEKYYDNILCITTLHLLEKKVALQLLEKIKHFTTAGGINFIAGFVQEHNNLFTDILPANIHPSNAFVSFYLDWQLLYYKRFMVRNLDKKQVEYFILVARKWS